MTENAQTQQRMLLAIVTGPDSDNVEYALEKTSYTFAKLPSGVDYCVNAVLLS